MTIKGQKQESQNVSCLNFKHLWEPIQGSRKVHTKRDEEVVRSVGPWPSFLFNPSRTPILGHYLHPTRTEELENLMESHH